jgi:hypothetical protein
VQSEFYTATNGAIGHATTHCVPCHSAGTSPPQAQVLGAAFGESAASEASKQAASKGTSYAVQYCINGAINHADKKKQVAS